jgi:hypothetical protein
LLNTKGSNYCLIARRQQLPTQPCTFFWIADCLALDGVIRSDNRGSESLFPLYLTAGDGRANFAPRFVNQFGKPAGRPPSAPELLGYIYALFHSPTYRDRYAQQLRSAFPRVLVPRRAELFAELAAIGRRLIDLHLLGEDEPQIPGSDAGGDDAVQTAVAAYRVGGYVVLRKLQIRPPGRAADDRKRRVAAAISGTIALLPAIDQAIARRGGFPGAWQGA